ncbi:hypothetical protein D3C83_270360 [compost metagenome]
MILAVSVLSQSGPALPLEVEGRRIEEHQIQVAEQLPPTIKQGLLERILDAARGERRRPDLLVLG